MIRISPGADGTTRRDHIEQACLQAGKTPEEMGIVVYEEDSDAREIPEGGEYLWAWFQELSSGRGNNGFGPIAIPWSDIDAWARIAGIPLAPFEALALRSMDVAFLSACAEVQRKQNKNKGKR